MRRIRYLIQMIGWLALVCFVVLATISVGHAAEKQICITFDDLPVVRVHDRIERLIITDEILGVLDEFGVKAAGFVVGNNVEDDIDILESWLEAGHILGNHTFSHPDLNGVPIDLYKADIDKGGELLEKLQTKSPSSKKYFRYPYLHYGTSVATKEAIAGYLQKEKYIQRLSHQA